ncbi:MAG TPA: hypothetical protein PLG75_10505 [Methanoculleus sp.]|nr:hypothetical protein [Methanoculleus sp.]
MRQMVYVLIILFSVIISAATGIITSSETPAPPEQPTPGAETLPTTPPLPEPQATGTETLSPVPPESQIAVTGITISPEVFMHGDTGVIGVEIRNTGATGVAISAARLFPDSVAVVNDKTYNAVGTIAPGSTMQFSFTVKADVADGVYYPEFYLDLRDGGSFRYHVPVRVSNSPIWVSVLDAPETFPADSEDTIVLSIGNPRENMVNGVTITPTGSGFTSTPKAVFLGNLPVDVVKNASFNITASQETDLKFVVSYRNGINQHNETLSLPVVLGQRTVDPEMVINNVEITRNGASVNLTGDVTNAGLKDAYSVQVTVGSPAQAVAPYPVYVVGRLEPDDFSSFEITCRAEGASSVPLIVQYRDVTGKVYEKTVTVSLTYAQSQGNAGVRAGTGPGGEGISGPFGGGFWRVPILEIVLAFIGGVAVAVAWRKGYFSKIRNRPPG